MSNTLHHHDTMKYVLKHLLLALVALSALMAVSTLWAAVVSVSASPSALSVPLGGSSSLNIIWNVTAFPTTTTLSSSQGTFRAGSSSGAVLGTVNTTVSRSVPIGVTTSLFAIPETVLIPSDVIFRAHKLGFDTINYSRGFRDCPACAAVTGSGINISIRTSSAATFSLSRIALSFDDGTPIRILDSKERLYALAEINFTGNGLLQGVWEVAGPTSTAGVPVYRPLAAVRQYLVGGDKQTLRSPDLPSDSSGLYLVRMRITDPVPGFEQPVIRYFTGSGRPGEQVPVLPIGLITPPNRTVLAPDTTFTWEPIRGARAYQLEVYAKPRTPGDTLPDLDGDIATPPPAMPATPLVTGMLVSGNEPRTALSTTARARLKSDVQYLWRVLAIGGDSAVIGESPVRELRMP